MNEMEISINGVNGQHLITGIAENDVIQTVSATSTNRGKYFVYVGKNKSVTISFANHYGYQNPLYQANLTLISGTNYSESLGEYVNFTGNASATIHTGNYEYVMFNCDHQTAYTATFTDISDDIKLVNGYQLDNNLTSVANAIRTKSGGSSPLAFPSGFVSEIGNIPSGGSIAVPRVPGHLRVYYELEDYIGDGLDLYWYGGNSTTSLTNLYASQHISDASGYVDFVLQTLTYQYLILSYSGYKNYGVAPRIALVGNTNYTSIKDICASDSRGFFYSRVSNTIYLALTVSDLSTAAQNNGLVTYLTASLED